MVASWQGTVQASHAALEKEREITELGVGQLLAKLSKGELKAEEVTVSGAAPLDHRLALEPQTISPADT